MGPGRVLFLGFQRLVKTLRCKRQATADTGKVTQTSPDIEATGIALAGPTGRIQRRFRVAFGLKLD